MENRRGPQRPYFKSSAEKDHAVAAFFTVALTLALGAMIGATITLMVMQ